MEVHILTIFPEMFTAPLQASILQRAQERCLLQVHIHNLRDFTTDRHHVTDDAPYGGGAGMIMKPEPLVTGVHAIQMELAQSTHLATEAPPFAYDPAKADRLRTHLKDILVRIEQIAPSLKL